MKDNIFKTIATSLIHHGDDMRDVARDLAEVLKELISEGLGTNDHKTILAEVAFLMHFSNDETHREVKREID